MWIQFSPVIAAKPRQLPGFTSLHYVDLDELGVPASPIAVLGDFRVDGLPFSPRPHAGFAAVTYVLQDSRGGVRSRASLGVDLVVGPGGIVWTEAGSGVVHEEIPAVPGRGTTRASDLRQPQLHEQAHRAPGATPRTGRGAAAAPVTVWPSP